MEVYKLKLNNLPVLPLYLNKYYTYKFDFNHFTINKTNTNNNNNTKYVPLDSHMHSQR